MKSTHSPTVVLYPYIRGARHRNAEIDHIRGRVGTEMRVKELVQVRIGAELQRQVGKFLSKRVVYTIAQYH